MLHFVFFDGTSAFVGSDVDATADTQVVFKSSDLDACDEFCDDYNDSL